MEPCSVHWIRGREKLLQQVNSQHHLQREWWPAYLAGRLVINLTDQRMKVIPGNHRPLLDEEDLLPSFLLGNSARSHWMPKVAFGSLDKLKSGRIANLINFQEF